MLISFFEEFPNEENLAKLKQVSWDTKIYLACKNLKEFLTLESKILKKYPQVKECIFWPTLKISEGYWISPWSDQKALKKLFNSLLEEQKKRIKNKEKALSVMLDFEPPKIRKQIIKRFFSFSKNRKTIIEFLVDAKKAKINVYNIEMSHLPESIVWFLGLGYSPRAFGHKNIAMYYSSFLRRYIGDKVGAFRFKQKVKKFSRRNMLVGVGLIATGIHESEPIYGPKELEEDLSSSARFDISEVIIFRLGGMNQKMQKVCEKYV